ncbi:hypothetical protein LMG29542_02825 [Paraburkholderia humisilvae]|uniref:Uncharacterized protein n=2 Tax=Paraburkholderia humisilvae TaxID=627669 RepID=A0A6J5DQM8_9BURK|nr:hypothetical protein LMG29542_02825 [Paraburkholderia humisilvae]
MADSANNGALHPGAFSLSWSGGLEYGSRELSFDGEGKFYFAKGDTINDDTQTGVGVFVLNLQKSDLHELRTVAQNLCDKDIQGGGPETVDPPSTFSVVCLDEGGKAVRRSGSMQLIPERFNRSIFDVPFKLSERAWSEGSKIIKLDFETSAVEYKSGHYIVAVRFINSGTRWVKFKTPDQWGGTTVSGRLGVGAVNKVELDGEKKKVEGSWAFGLNNANLINRKEFEDGFVVLKAGDSKTLKFQVMPDYKALKGIYDFSGIAFMRIEYEGHGWGLATNVDLKPIKTRIKIDRDYPSTPEEREQWEQTHRTSMLRRPVKPGETFVEDGLYRAVRLIPDTNYRGLYLKPFKAGQVASIEDVRMPMESLNGVNIDGPVQWIWEASAPTPVKQWSFDIIEDTAQFCKPGVTCPRSGRWVPRVSVSSGFGPPEYQYQLAGIVTRRRGETMPPVDGKYAEWEWLGAAHG